MSVIVTWNNGTPLGPHGASTPVQYAVGGSIASRGAGLAAAIAAEVGLDPTKVAINGTDVLVDGQALMTIADGEVDLPTNRRLGMKVLGLIKQFSGDPRTAALQLTRADVRIMKVKLGMSKAQVLALVGSLYDAIVMDG